MKKTPRLIVFSLLGLTALGGAAWLLGAHHPAGLEAQHATRGTTFTAAGPDTAGASTEPAADPQAMLRQSAPALTWLRPPVADAQNYVNVAFRIDAASPLQTIRMRVRPAASLPASASGGASAAGADEDIVDVPAFALGRKNVEWDGTVDLTHSLFSGQAVTLQILAEDNDHRTGESAPASVTLPERAFRSPMARNIYQLRRDLQQEPQRRLDGLRALAAMLQDRDSFNGQDLTLLALRSAAVRIALDKSDDGLRSALDLLWHAALLAEDSGQGVRAARAAS